MEKIEKQRIDREEHQNVKLQMLASDGQNRDWEQLQHRREALAQLYQWQQDRTPVMQELFQDLSGLAVVEKNGEITLTPVDWNTGCLNPFGAKKIVDFLKPLDRNVMLGNWTDKNIMTTMRLGVGHTIRNYLFYNHDSIDLKLADADYVLNMILNATEATYWRGWNDGERRKDKEIIKIQELKEHRPEEKKKTLFGMEA